MRRILADWRDGLLAAARVPLVGWFVVLVLLAVLVIIAPFAEIERLGRACAARLCHGRAAGGGDPAAG